MKKLNQNQEIAGRKISEILSRFDKKIRDPRSFPEGKKTVKIINAEKLGAKVISNKQMLNFIKKKKFN